MVYELENEVPEEEEVTGAVIRYLLLDSDQSDQIWRGDWCNDGKAFNEDILHVNSFPVRVQKKKIKRWCSLVSSE